VSDPDDLARAFDAAFGARAPAGLSVRPEADDDAAFLRELFLASYPLRDVLPEPVLTQQIELRLATFRQAFAGAMRRIAVGADGPVGRIIIDWRHAAAASHCVDIAVRPTAGGRGVGTALLQAWIDVASAHGLACSLTVAPGNPVRALYARLGFEERPGEADLPDEVSIAMVRRPRP
jgi:ribosomal protein S18 acetylase RimI-like enzyme